MDPEELTEATETSRYPLVARAVYETPWAIQPAKLEEILAFINLKLRGDDVDPDQVAAITASRPAAAITSRRGAPFPMTGSIAVLPLLGTIIPRAGGLSEMSGATSVQRFRSLFRAALSDDRVSAIVFDVDSPGGMVAGVPELADEIYAARGKKPIIAQVNALTASAAYWIASQADEVVVTRSGEVGSIGVIMAHVDESDFWASMGVKVNFIHAGRFKAEGSPYERLSDEARAHFQSIVNTYYDMFVAAVARGRGVSAQTVREEFGEGRVLTANDAVRRGMADRVAPLRHTLARAAGRRVRDMDLSGLNAAVEDYSTGGEHPDDPHLDAGLWDPWVDLNSSLSVRIRREDAPRVPDSDALMTAITEAVEADGDASEGKEHLLGEGRLIESADGGDGWRWRVQIIQAGVSVNRTEYPLDVLHRRAGLYEGVPVFYGAGRDHNPNERGFASVAGYIRDPRPNASGVEATLEINRGKPELRESIMHAWEVYRETGRASFGFSHVVPPGKFTTEIRRVAGALVKRVRDYTQVESVDIVMRPSAGGRLIGLMAAADSGATERELVAMEHEELLARLRAGETLTADERAILRDADVVAYEDALLEGRLARQAPVAVLEEAVELNVPMAPEVDALTETMRQRLAEFEAMQERAQLAECENILRRRLDEARLPGTLAEAIREDFAGRVFASDDLERRISRDREMASRLIESVGGGMPRGIGVDIEVTADERDRWQAAMDGFFGLVRSDDGPQYDRVVRWFDTPSHFRSLSEAFQAITGHRSATPAHILMEAVAYLPPTADEALQEAIETSTFGSILGDSIRRRMIARYRQPDLQTFMQLVSTTPSLADFRVNRRVRYGGYGNLPVVSQGSPYQPLSTPSEEEVTYQPGKRGGTESLTLETLMNDDMELVRAIPVELANAAVYTLRDTIFIDVLQDNPNYGVDSKAIFHNDHGNLGSTALSQAAVTATRAAMRQQSRPASQATRRLADGNVPRRLFVPADLEETAFKISQSSMAVTSTEDATVPNLHRGIDYTVVDEWTDATDWVAAADPASTPIIELGFIGGNPDPELFVQDDPRSGTPFSADKIEYKIRHMWGYVVLDYRGIFKHVVSGS